RSPRGPRTTPGHAWLGPASSPDGRSSCTCRFLAFRLLQRAFAEGEDLLPAVHRLFLTVRRPVVVEEAVTSPIVAMELVLLAVLLELRLVRVDLLGRGRLVLVPEQPEQRARQ